MKNLAFLGFGKFAEQILYNFNIDSTKVSIFDSTIKHAENLFPFDKYLEKINQFNWIIAIGYHHLQKKVEILQTLIGESACLENLIHNSCNISPSSSIYPGVTIYPMCNIDHKVTISSGVILHNSVTVSHDSYIGRGTYISPGAVISGNVTIGNGVFIGAGSIISNGITIGDNVIVGIGTVVTSDLPANSCVIGNPMRFLNQKIKLK